MSEDGDKVQSRDAQDAMKGFDSVDACRLRLMSLRARIESNWPSGGGILRRRGPGTDSLDTISRLMAALPSPLPLAPGGNPEQIVRETDADARQAAARAVDAALALLAADSLDATYPGQVTMLGLPRGTQNAKAGAAEAPEGIEISDPTIGLLVATIIGTLDAVSERLIPATGGRNVRGS